MSGMGFAEHHCWWSVLQKKRTWVQGGPPQKGMMKGEKEEGRCGSKG